MILFVKDDELTKTGRFVGTILGVVYMCLLFNGGTSFLWGFFGSVLYTALTMMAIEAVVYAAALVYIIFWEMPRALYNRARRAFN